MIKIENLKHYYTDSDGNEVKALDGVDLTIEQGEFVAIIGANGSGKSTLARHLNCLLLPTDGRVEISGLDTREEKNMWDIRQQVGMVFQNPDNQIVAAVAEEDVAFGPENIGVPGPEIAPRVAKALAAVGMTEYAKHAPHRLSGGQKQRVAIAGIMALEPKRAYGYAGPPRTQGNCQHRAKAEPREKYYHCLYHPLHGGGAGCGQSGGHGEGSHPLHGYPARGL